MQESSKKDPNQITRCEHDDESNSKRVMVVNTEMGMELSHSDGDSIFSIPSVQSVSMASGDVVSISDFREYQVFSDEEIDSISISPEEDGSFFVQLGGNFPPKSPIFKDIGLRIKVISPLSTKIVLVGRS